MRNECEKKKDENESKQPEANTPQQKVEEKVEDIQSPAYVRELSVYKNETLQKIDEFRKARSSWIESNTLKKIETDADEDARKANLYKGRCHCLRRISFKAKFFRHHRKTVRPIHLSLKSKLAKLKLKKSSAQPREKVRSVRRINIIKKIIKKKGKDKPTRDSNISDMGSLSVRNIKKDKDDAVNPKRDSKICDIGSPVSGNSSLTKIETSSDESSRKLFRPSKKAIKKLKAAKANAETEPCNEGSVPLKNVCPNNKRVSKRSKIKKNVDEYSRLIDEDVKSEKGVSSRLTDSLEIQEKNKNKKRVSDIDSEETVGGVKSEKVKFSHLTDSLERHRRELERKKISKEIQKDDQLKALPKAHETFGEEKLHTKDKEDKDGKTVSLVNLCEDSGRVFTKEELIKMGRMWEETFIFKL